MLNTLKKKISDKFLKNHSLVPNSPVDVREFSDNPRILNYMRPRKVLMNAKLKHGRCFNFFPLAPEVNPFIRALVESEAADETKKKLIIKQTISEYYQNNQPENVYDWYNLPPTDAPKLINTPPWSAPMPWSTGSISSEKNTVERWILQDNIESGMDLNIDHGFTYYGPVSEKKLEVETNRLLSIYQSIKNKGYIRNDKYDGDIGGKIFISSNGEWRWRVFRGQHRTIALAALGYTEIPIMVKQIIYETEVDCWPNVLSGLYTSDGAKKLFKTVFNGSTDHLSI